MPMSSFNFLESHDANCDNLTTGSNKMEVSDDLNVTNQKVDSENEANENTSESIPKYERDNDQ
jgi:hypothetical protein